MNGTGIKVKKIIAEVLHVPVEEVLDGARMKELGMDSLDDVEITMALEEEFDISISDKVCEQVDVVSDWIAIVNHRILRKKHAGKE